MTIDRDELRKLADAATPGPWEADGREVSQHWSRPEPWKTIVGTEVACMAYCYGGSAEGVERAEDAAFIAAARTAVPALLDALTEADAATTRATNRAAHETARADHWREKHRVMARKRDTADRAYRAERKAREDAEARIAAVRKVLEDLEQQSPEQIGWDAAAVLPRFRDALS